MNRAAKLINLIESLEEDYAPAFPYSKTVPQRLPGHLFHGRRPNIPVTDRTQHPSQDILPPPPPSSGGTPPPGPGGSGDLNDFDNAVGDINDLSGVGNDDAGNPEMDSENPEQDQQGSELDSDFPEQPESPPSDLDHFN
jgi:hypothetical protein